MNKGHHSRPIGRQLLTDGTVRDVYEDARGQYVLDDDGLPVRGQWLPPPDEPLVIDGHGRERRHGPQS